MEGIADSLRFSLAAFNISVTQINAGPVRTKFTDVYGSVEKGGYGTREIPGDADDGHYLAGFTQLMVDTLSQRMKSGEAQDQESVARVIVNVAHMKKDARKLVEASGPTRLARASSRPCDPTPLAGQACTPSC